MKKIVFLSILLLLTGCSGTYRLTMTDTGGVKEEVCEAGFKIAEKYGFTFVGGHPMAGKQYSGFKYSREDLYENASMIIVPEK